MPVSLAQFLSQLTATGILAPDAIQALKDSLPADKLAADDAQYFARELVRQRKLTSFQATAIYKNNGQALLIGDYIVLEKLGQGGMGTVYKAEFRRMKRVVALKVMSGAAMKSPEAVQRFLREVEAAARLTHENIVAALDAGQAQGFHFLVMEYVDGSDLSALVKKKGPLPVDRAVQYILQAARGLAHAHAAGVVHRDIKPANLLLDRSGVVKILDMGLARLDAAAGRQSDLTQTGAIMGTVDYMAPEQALNTKSATARADMYSLGMSLWYLLTGKAAYGGDSLMGKLLAHREQPIPSLASCRSDVPAAVEAVFRRLAAKHPDERYATTAEVIADLEACLSGGLVKATTAGASTSAVTISSELSAVEGPDAAVQDFLQAIAVTASIPGERTSIDPAGKSSDTLGVRSGGTTSTAPARKAASSLPQKLLSQRGLMAAASIAVLLLGGLIALSSSGGKGRPSNSGDTAQKSKTAADETKTVAGDGTVEPGRRSGWHGWPADAPRAAVVPFSIREARKHQEAWARFLKVPVEQTNGMGMEFRLIPPGEFKMGLTESQDRGLCELTKSDKSRFDSAKPQHAVHLTRPFYMGANEVRYGEFVELLHRMPGNIAREDWMADDVGIARGASWSDAVEFCNALSIREGKKPCYRIDGDSVELADDGEGYRLPTEAEWEFACRAGTETVWFYGLDPLDQLRNPKSSKWAHSEHVAAAEYGTSRTYVQSNPFGLARMYAGADEWCWDGFVSYASLLTGAGVVLENPTGGASADRVKLGGASWSDGGGDLSSINSVARTRANPKVSGKWSGLGRVVLTVPPAKKQDRSPSSE